MTLRYSFVATQPTQLTIATECGVGPVISLFLRVLTTLSSMLNASVRWVLDLVWAEETTSNYCVYQRSVSMAVPVRVISRARTALKINCVYVRS